MDLSIFKKITDFIMPLEPIEEEETEEKVEEKTEKKVTPAKSETQQMKAEEPSEELRESFSAMQPVQEFGRMRTAEGGSVAFAGMKYTAYAQKEPVIAVKPQLTVVKGAGISVRINKPTKFEEVRNIADDLLEKNVVIVNYELVETEEQTRISDFVNGVCYVTDGHVNPISEKIVLYTPNGVDTEAALAGYAMR